MLWLKVGLTFRVSDYVAHVPRLNIPHAPHCFRAPTAGLLSCMQTRTAALALVGVRRTIPATHLKKLQICRAERTREGISVPPAAAPHAPPAAGNLASVESTSNLSKSKQGSHAMPMVLLDKWQSNLQHCS